MKSSIKEELLGCACNCILSTGNFNVSTFAEGLLPFPSRSSFLFSQHLYNAKCTNEDGILVACSQFWPSRFIRASFYLHTRCCIILLTNKHRYMMLLPVLYTFFFFFSLLSFFLKICYHNLSSNINNN